MIYNKMVGGNMKKNKGFTLIEILAVVTIIGLIFILVIPKITTSLKNKKSDVDTTTTNLVLSATKLYVSDHSSKFEKTEGNVSCMPLRELVDKGYLDGPVKNVTDDLDITNSNSVRITYNKGFKYELVDSGECSVVYNEILKDKDGNKYTIVEYIESTGTQYIDTGVTWNTSIQRIEGEVLFTDYQTGGGLNISPWVKEGNNYYGLSIKNSDSIPVGRFLIGNNYTNFQNIYYLNTKYYYVIDRNDAYINGNQVATVNNSSNSSSTMYEFANHRDGIANIFEYKQLYYLKIYNNDTLVRDFIPVIDSSERPCLFDKVENKCYYNQGTGEFLWG